MRRAPTLQDRLTTAHNRPSGFDYLRVGLSIAVMASHEIYVCLGYAGQEPYLSGPWRPLIYIIVPAFFALSGFLVASSLERNSLPSFYTLRALRIFPALVVEVIVSAVLIGSALTTLPWQTYFTSHGFWAYFLNTVGYIHYVLPGVFGGLPTGPIVNTQLWTIPFELECYLALGALSLLGIYKRQPLFWSLAILLCILACVVPIIQGVPTPNDQPPPARLVVLAFLFGVGLFALRERIPWNWGVFAISAALCWVCFTLPGAVYLAPLPVAYVTVFVGLLNPRRLHFMRVADYSYGVYLYGFPVQQTISYLFPAYRVWYINLPASLLVTGLMAAFSWHFIESRVLGHKQIALEAVERLAVTLRRLGGRVSSVKSASKTDRADVSCGS